MTPILAHGQEVIGIFLLWLLLCLVLPVLAICLALATRYRKTALGLSGVGLAMALFTAAEVLKGSAKMDEEAQNFIFSEMTPRFLARLWVPTNTIAIYLRSQLSSNSLDALRDSSDIRLNECLEGDFNRIIRGPSIYEGERFAGISLRPETKELLASRPKGRHLMRLNHLLLQDAFPEELVSFPLQRNKEGDYVILLALGVPLAFSGLSTSLALRALYRQRHAMSPLPTPGPPAKGP